MCSLPDIINVLPLLRLRVNKTTLVQIDFLPRSGIMPFKLRSAQNHWPFVPLSNLHNPFSELSAKTMHPTCENKQRYKWMQCLANDPPMSHLSLFSASFLICLLSRTIYSLTYNMVNVFSRFWVYLRKKSSAWMISICLRRSRCALHRKRSKPRSSRWTWTPKSTHLFLSKTSLELCLFSNQSYVTGPVILSWKWMPYLVQHLRERPEKMSNFWKTNTGQC